MNYVICNSCHVRITSNGLGGLGVSVLASGIRVRGFKPGRSRRVFRAKKILSTPPFGGKVKPSVPCRTLRHVKDPKMAWKSSFQLNLPDNTYHKHYQMMVDERSSTCVTWLKEDTCIPEGMEHLEDLRVREKHNEFHCGTEWERRYNWHRGSDRLLWTRQWIFGFHKTWATSD